jgi:pheromone shutdown protein TraB
MTKDEAHAAIEEAEKAGFDLSLVDSNLTLSIEERLLRHDAALEFKLTLHAAGEAMYAQAAHAAATPR